MVITLALQGLITGIVFGFLLQKGRLTQFNVIVSQLLLRDFTFLKILLTAVTFASIGIYAMLIACLLPTFIVNTTLPHLGIIIGGLLSGVGMALLGYFPSSCVAAAGQGSKDAWFGILGMIAGAFVFLPHEDCVRETLLSTIVSKSLSLQELFHSSPWVIIAAIALGTIALYSFVKR